MPATCSSSGYGLACFPRSPYSGTVQLMACFSLTQLLGLVSVSCISFLVQHTLRRFSCCHDMVQFDAAPAPRVTVSLSSLCMQIRLYEIRLEQVSLDQIRQCLGPAFRRCSLVWCFRQKQVYLIFSQHWAICLPQVQFSSCLGAAFHRFGLASVPLALCYTTYCRPTCTFFF